MSEVLSAQTGKLIAQAIHEWLAGEVATSSVDRNQYLDGFDKWQAQMRLGYDEPTNWSARKNEAHVDRLPIWMQAYELDPLDEEASAKIMFAGLMFVSGAYRNQSYLQSATAQEYMKKRENAVGVSIREIVEERLSYWLPEGGNLSDAEIEVDEIKELSRKSSSLGEFTVRRIYMRGVWEYDFDKDDSISVRYMKLAQRRWLEFATDAVILAAKLRGGDVRNVPFLHPVNISDNPGVEYPIRRLAT